MPEAQMTLDAVMAPLPPQHGFPFDWYWERQDGTVFSSDRIANVPKSDEAFVEWSEDGRIPTTYPQDADGNDSVVEMQKVLDAYDLHATLEHYAGGLRYAKVQEPITITVDGKDYRFQTDDESTAKLSSSVQLGEQYEAVNGVGSFQTPWKTADGFTDGPLSLADLKTVGLAIGMNEARFFGIEAAAVAGIASGAIKTKADVEAAFVPKPATKAASKATVKSAS